MGKLYVIGIGPGGSEHMTLKARAAIEESNIIVGYIKYIDMIKDLIKDKTIYSNGMMGEEERCREALRLSKDNIVSVISTGDSGIYGMAGLILELADEMERKNIEVIPGVTASSAAASIVGAPLMHDNCNISLSDLMTPYELIKKRVEAAAFADFIISFYNPRSKGRPNYLREAIEIIKKYRNSDTPVAVVKNALRDGEEASLFTLETFDDSIVDMLSIVIVGNSQTYIKGGKMITPRGYFQ
ncbi:precorrin-3B C(17)-methyltransferase [Clostridium bovifaecis]|uniref:Precorrin-3B C(17)-methyltransferase n=1 Tax=Clostridium bovifaecis TaxID=2184719 RepID=A0A6I6F9N1_9CLOT|nr:precorrin-3B C(17)-methyltransferase [Clostridium bovifaecis]